MNRELLMITPLIVCVGIAALWDIKTGKIPNRLTYPMMFSGLVFHATINGLSGIGFSAAGLLIGTFIFFIPYLMGGMGAGDAKLMGGTGAFLGYTGVTVAAVISVLVGLIYAIILLLIHRNYGSSFLRRSYATIKTFFFTRQWVPIPAEKEEKQPVLSYAVPIALGTLATIYIKVTGNTLIQDLLNFQFVI